MSSRGPTADQIADHQRDHRKHERRPGDSMLLDRHQVATLIKLVGYCQGITATDDIGALVAPELRSRTRDAAAALDLPAREVV